MNLDSVVCHGCRGAHVSRENFQLYLNFVNGGLSMLSGIGSYNGNGVTKLEHFFVAEDWSVPTIPFVIREGD